ncbi:hypothetical protein B0H13DRAFT_1906393 [Mycena leptocephala]|nr:hypothetical protein B0H13DRAFT_1906393 [Mycena leptocephala]
MSRVLGKNVKAIPGQSTCAVLGPGDEEFNMMIDSGHSYGTEGMKSSHPRLYVLPKRSVHADAAKAANDVTYYGRKTIAMPLLEKALELSKSYEDTGRAAGTLGVECTTQLGDYQDSIVQLCGAAEILAICGMSGGGLDGYIKMSRAEYSGLVFINIADSSVMIGAAKEDVEADLNQAKKIFSAGNYCPGVITSAMQLFQECLNLTWGRDNQVVTFCLERLADTRRRHTLGCAPTWPAVFLSHEQKSREKLAVHKALLCLGDLFIAHGDDGTAHTLSTHSVEANKFKIERGEGGAAHNCEGSIRLVGASSPEFEIQGCAVSQWNIGPGMQGLKFAWLSSDFSEEFLFAQNILRPVSESSMGERLIKAPNEYDHRGSAVKIQSAQKPAASKCRQQNRFHSGLPEFSDFSGGQRVSFWSRPQLLLFYYFGILWVCVRLGELSEEGGPSYTGESDAAPWLELQIRRRCT